MHIVRHCEASDRGEGLLVVAMSLRTMLKGEREKCKSKSIFMLGYTYVRLV